mmetsp:Transcript_8528/g.27442  ORF Transcript_8528/g.27442 Transcript_8528/m.27442 type:complete len:232 (-) Transcript_8528:312-1007(-)
MDSRQASARSRRETAPAPSRHESRQWSNCRSSTRVRSRRESTKQSRCTRIVSSQPALNRRMVSGGAGLGSRTSHSGSTQHRGPDESKGPTPDAHSHSQLPMAKEDGPACGGGDAADGAADRPVFLSRAAVCRVRSASAPASRQLPFIPAAAGASGGTAPRAYSTVSPLRGEVRALRDRTQAQLVWGCEGKARVRRRWSSTRAVWPPIEWPSRSMGASALQVGNSGSRSVRP